jgi:tripartite-type tricarboxylate transporter receptor subunit TctC
VVASVIRPNRSGSWCLNPAGSTPDIIGRVLAERLQASLGQPFVVENRSGAGGSIGAESGGESRRPARAAHRRQRAGGHQQAPLPYDPDKDLRAALRPTDTDFFAAQRVDTLFRRQL